MTYSLTEAIVFVAALLAGGIALYWIGRMAGWQEGVTDAAESAVEEVWDTAVLLGSYGEYLRQQSRDTGIPVHELAGCTLPPRAAGPCPLCGAA